MLKKLILLTIMLAFLISPVYADWKFNPFTGKMDYYESITSSPTFTGILTLPAGSVTAPSVVSDDADSGFYFGSKSFNWAVDGANAFTVNSSKQVLFSLGTLGTPSFSFTGYSTTGMYYDAGIKISIAGSSDHWFGSSLYRIGGDVYLYREAANNLQVGQDAATASSQTISAPDSTGASQNGANLILEGGQPGSGGVEGRVQFNSVTQMNEPDAAALAVTRTTKTWNYTKTLAADTDNACGTEVDCITLPVPTSTGRCEIWYGTLYMLAILANDGTATVITDSDAAGTDIEYNAAIASCAGMCLHDGGTNSKIFNDTASAADVHVSCVYD